MNKASLRPSLSVIAAALLLSPCLSLSQTISASAASQINDILQEKKKFTAAQQKIGSSLVFGAQLARGALAGKSFAGIVQIPPADASGLTVVDIKGTVPVIAAQVAALGGKVISQSPAYNTLRAALPLQSIEALAANPAVVTISPKKKAILSAGSLTTQGYISHTADAVVTGLGIDGSGVKVGVLSDSATPSGVAALIASGDLPANTTVLPGLDGGAGTDEGIAMMEIIHDLAPGAQLYFATAFATPSEFAANITALGAAGCSIIVDDVTYSDEAAFQDGPIAQAINTFAAGGGLYVSSAGNSGNITNGTSGTWEGDFVDGGPVSNPNLENGNIHLFGGLTYDSLVGGAPDITLKWSDALGHSGNDYDLFILDGTGAIVKAASVDFQGGTQDPIEEISSNDCLFGGYCPAAGDRIVVVLFKGSPRALRIDTNRGRLSVATTGATSGHNAAANVITVAATNWNSARTGTKPFAGFANATEFFSSDGPRKIFFNPDGTPITPGNFLFATNGGATLQKPDLTGADGAIGKTPGFSLFFGTSAAAPHVAAVAALVKSAKPSLTNTQIKSILLNTALDNMAPGWDRDGGFGLGMALRAVQAALQ